MVVWREGQIDLVYTQRTKSSFNGGYLRYGWAWRKSIADKSLEPPQTWRSLIETFSRTVVGPTAMIQGRRACL